MVFPLGSLIDVTSAVTAVVLTFYKNNGYGDVSSTTRVYRHDVFLVAAYLSACLQKNPSILLGTYLTLVNTTLTITFTV